MDDNEKLCRLCLKMTAESVGLFQFKNGVLIADLVKIICPIEIERHETPQLPQHCCLECLELIVDATHLRDLSLMNDYELRQGLEAVETQMKDEVVEVDYSVEALDESLIAEEFHEPPTPQYSIEIINTEVVSKVEPKKGAFCELCKFNFATPGSLKRHQLRRHSGNFECDHCGANLKTKHDLVRHIEKQHIIRTPDVKIINTKQANLGIAGMFEKLPEPMPLSCSFCSFTDHDEEKVNKHLLVHQDVVDSGKMYCSLCPSPITSMKKLVEHTQFHNEKIKTHKCLVCHKSFAYDDKFINHLRNHRKNQSKICFCPECGRKFSKPTLLDDHIRFIHKKEALFCCPRCGQGFGSKSALNGHIRRHIDGQKYKCPFCSRSFSSHNLLNSHKNVHSADRPFSCPQCDRKFKHQKVLSDHLKRHEGSRQLHVCDICDRAVYSSYALSRHMLVHSGSKPHQCEYCHKSYAQKNDLNKHLRIHLGENTYFCDFPFCAESFRIIGDLRVHESIHYVKGSS